MLRRARALDRLGRRDEAVRAYAALDSLWRGADAGHPDRTEVRWGSTPRDPRVAVLDTVEYASGALRLRGMLLRPAAAGRRPAVVLLHGSQGCWDVLDVEGLGGVFATRGYVAFFPCRRGVGLSRGQGVAVMAQIAQEGIVERDARFGARITELLGTTQLDDVLAAVAAVRARGDVDPARVAVAGVSFGGILTLLAAERDSTLRAAVSFAPAAMNWGWNAPLRARLTEAARRTRVPTLFVQAENDWSTEPARALSTAMRAGGGETAARIYPPLGGDVGTGHALMLLAPDLWRDEVFAFLDRHVGAGTAGAAGAAAPVRRTPSGP
jgi:dienelactone hydrolase